MISVKDCLERSLNGPIMKEKKFDLKVASKLRELYGEIGFTEDLDQVIPDDDIADAIFDSAVELLVEVGLYNKDSQRVIQFSKDEIMEIANTRLSEVTIGNGNDAVLVRHRDPDSPFAPVIVSGPVGGPLTEDIFLPCHISFAQEPTCQGILGGVLLNSGNIENSAGRPEEMIVTQKEARLLNEAVAAVGKPGLYVGVYPVSGISPEAIFNTYTVGDFDPQRGQVAIQLMPELKLSWSKLKLAIFCLSHGVHPWTDIVTVIGGFTRNPVESSISQIAGILGTFAFDQGSTAAVWSTTINGLCTTRRNLWSNCATTRALDRNVGNPVFLLGYASAGPATEMCLLETVAYTLAYTASGGELIWGGSAANGIDVNRQAGLHGRMMGETAHAVAGTFDREQANDAIRRLFEIYEDDLPKAPKGKTFDECYDVATVKPTKEYLNIYDSVKSRLSDEFGIQFDY